MGAWYLRRALPWSALAGCLGVAGLLVAAAHRWDSLAGVCLCLAALVTAAGVAFLLDEPATAVTGVSPRGGRWARVHRLLVAPAVLGTGVLLVASVPGQAAGAAGEWGLVLAGLGALAVLLATLGSVRRSARPGGTVATTVVLAGMVPMVLGVFFELDAAYPVRGLSTGMMVAWATAAAVGLVGTGFLVVRERP